jgi:hypothetical protein
MSSINPTRASAKTATPARLVGTAAIAIAAGAMLAAAYQQLLRARVLNWGASPDEVAARIPGDELLEDADVVATRAITVDAPPEAIWPWLVQMGVGRAGAYTYDWIERLCGLDIRSADRIIPELQDLHAGDVLPMRPNEPGMRIEILATNRAMASRSEDGSWVWSFALVAHNGSTRLISRNRMRVHGAQRVGLPAMEVGSLVMERKMLHGIKQRAQRRNQTKLEIREEAR